MAPISSVAPGGSGADVAGNLNEVIGQVQNQTAGFGELMKDPSFTGQSEMGLMLQLQRAMALETMTYQTVSNMEKARTDASKNAISNMR